MAYTREEKRLIYETYTEVYMSELSARALPFNEDLITIRRIAFGRSPRLDAAIDFFCMVGPDKSLLDSCWLPSTEKTRRPHNQDEKRANRRLWDRTNGFELMVFEYGLFLAEII